MSDTVVLRRWRDSGDLIALFPDHHEPGGMVSSYEHIGQHGPATWSITERTDPVRSDDEPGVAELMAELRRIGYNPVRRQRRPGRPDPGIREDVPAQGAGLHEQAARASAERYGRTIW